LSQTVDAAEPASRADSAEISPAFLVDSTGEAGPKGPSQEVIAAVVDMKQRNPSWGCPRIAQQIALAFGISIDRDVVRRILACRMQKYRSGREGVLVNHPTKSIAA